METNKTKLWQVILGILILVGAGILIATTPKPQPQTPPVDSNSDDDGDDVTQNPNVNATQMCYIWNTEAGDKAQLSMDIRGEDVTGEFNWLPAEKDKKTGIFKGKISAVDPKTMARTITASWNVSAEGMTATEELRIIMGEGTANPGFGEMKEVGNGVFVYADPTKIDYSLNLSQTDCGDSAMN